MRKVLAGVVLIVGLALVAAITVVTYGPDLRNDSATALPVVTPQGEPGPDQVTTSPEPVNLLQLVAAFHPQTIRVYQDGMSQQRDFIARIPMDSGQLDVNDDGNVIHQDASGTYLGPREAPGVVVHWSRAWPGKDTGTTEIDCHARIYPPMACTPLMDLPTDKSLYDSSAYKVEITGPSGQLLIYAITEVVVLDKFDVATRPEFNENTPNRLLIYTCQVDDGQPVVSDRIVVATLISSKAD